jgi:nucleoside-diphosphate kinase
MIEKSLVLIKPDGVKRGLIGECLARFEKMGLKIIGMKMVWITKEFAEKHYYDVKERYDQKILDNLTDYLKKGPVIAIVLEGVDAIENIRKIVGARPYPKECAPGTIRGDFAHISKEHANAANRPVGNLIHASSNQKDAEHEINLWFDKKELHSYKTMFEEHLDLI